MIGAAKASVAKREQEAAKFRMEATSCAAWRKEAAVYGVAAPQHSITATPMRSRLSSSGHPWSHPSARKPAPFC